ncbi:MAG: shikimate dehydrogenase [Paramuribaculum sp.]|nr:shikimate dehydrogenase [Paramuribaculum sp.]
MHTYPKRLYGLIGFPLGHSFSQNYFNQKFQAEGTDAAYVNFEIPDIGDFMEVISENPNLAGLNVTIPYKEQVISYMNEMDPDAAKIGAVNVIKFIQTPKGPRFKGYNSDIIGFSDSIRPLLTPTRNKALVLGTGGAAKAVYHGLKNLGVEPTYVSRTKAPERLTYDELTAEIITDNKIIVNTTPLGMYPHIDECPDIPYEALSCEHLCYDLLYNPDTTLFMRKSSEFGAETKNGLEMLLLQAFAAWNIWNT